MADNFSGEHPLNDIELIKSVRNSEHEAFELLAGRFAPVINKILSSFNFSISERDDLFQEGLIGLYKAAMVYNSEISSFSTFAYVCIRSSVISALKKLGNPSLSLDIDTITDTEAVDFASPESAFLDKESLKALIDKIEGLLSRYESRILKLYLAGIPHSRIALIVGNNVKSVDNAIARIKKKLSVSLSVELRK